MWLPEIIGSQGGPVADQPGQLIARCLDGSPATDDSVLLVSELVANACAHSAQAARRGSATPEAGLAVLSLDDRPPGPNTVSMRA
jgi:hypothetical protein